MLTLPTIIILSTTISGAFLLITLLISKTYKSSMLKSNPFECGFNPLVSSRSSFSIQFFIIAILFLIFDIEIILILPIPISQIKNMLILTSTSITFFILMSGLIYEWKVGSLQWL